MGELKTAPGMSTEFGRKMRKRRLELGLTLDQLAEKVGSRKAYIWQLENKERARPSGDLVLKIADALGVSGVYLIDDAFRFGGASPVLQSVQDLRSLASEWQGRADDCGRLSRLVLAAIPTVPQEVREALEFYAGDCGDGGKRAFEALKAIGLLANPVEPRDGEPTTTASPDVQDAIEAVVKGHRIAISNGGGAFQRNVEPTVWELHKVLFRLKNGGKPSSDALANKGGSDRG